MKSTTTRQHGRAMKHRKLHSKKAVPETQKDYEDKEDSIQFTITCSESSSTSWSDEDNNSFGSLNENDNISVPPLDNELQLNRSHLHKTSPLEVETTLTHPVECQKLGDTEISQHLHSGVGPKLDSNIESGFYDEHQNDMPKDESQIFSQVKRIGGKLFHIICPLARPCYALLRCDMQTFWNILPSIVVIKALWLSFLCLGFCDLAKVVRLLPVEKQSDSNIDRTYVKESFSFGLWAYSKIVHDNYSMDGIVENEVERVETCDFNMGDANDGSPDDLFIFDAAFFFARAFAIITAALGSLSMLTLWLTSAKIQRLNTEKNRKRLGMSLLSCCIFQSLVLLIFASRVCRDTIYEEERHCSLEEGSGTIFGGCLFWLLTGLAMIKMSPPESTEADASDDPPDVSFSKSPQLQVYSSEPA
jgi:hypothetical protein